MKRPEGRTAANGRRRRNGREKASYFSTGFSLHPGIIFLLGGAFGYVFGKSLGGIPDAYLVACAPVSRDTSIPDPHADVRSRKPMWARGCMSGPAFVSLRPLLLLALASLCRRSTARATVSEPDVARQMTHGLEPYVAVSRRCILALHVSDRRVRFGSPCGATLGRP